MSLTLLNGRAFITMKVPDGKVSRSVIQSQRINLYQKYANQLVEEDKAYYCFCSPERLKEVREKQHAAKLTSSYDRHCRDLPKSEISDKLKRGEQHVIRMKVPVEGELTFTDIIRGEVTIAHKVLDDQVILKSDGYPTYHLAVVIDDHCMKISHVIRGEEWLSSTPKHVILFKHFGWEVRLPTCRCFLIRINRS